jgi:hypothetical protein
MIPQQELVLEIRAPELVGVLAEGELGALSTTTHPAAALHQAMTIQHRIDGAFGGDGDSGESAEEALANLAGTPTRVLALHVQDVVLHLKGELMGIAVRASASVGQPLHPTLLVAIEDLWMRGCSSWLAG